MVVVVIDVVVILWAVVEIVGMVVVPYRASYSADYGDTRASPRRSTASSTASFYTGREINSPGRDINIQYCSTRTPNSASL